MEQQTQPPNAPDPSASAQQQPPPYGPPPGEWARPVGTFDPRGKSPVLACVLSLVPGLGQIYVGYYQRGFIHAFVFAGLIAILATLADQDFTPLAPMTGILLFFFYLYNIIDAGRRAALYNQALQGGTSLKLPDDMEQPGFRGSLFGGTSLIVAGVILLGYTRFGMSIDWVEEWWPVIPIIAGFYFIYKNYESRLSDRDEKKRS